MGALNIVPDSPEIQQPTSGTPNYGGMNTPLVPQQEEQSTTPSVTEWARLRQQVENDDIGGKTTSSDYFPNMHDPITQQGFSGAGFSAPTIASGGVMPYAAADEFAMRRAEQEQAQAQQDIAEIEMLKGKLYKKDNMFRTGGFTNMQIDWNSSFFNNSMAILNSNEATKNLSPREKAKAIYSMPEFLKKQNEFETAAYIDNKYNKQAWDIIEDRQNKGIKSQYSESQYDAAVKWTTSSDNYMAEPTEENYKKMAKDVVMFETYMGMNELVKNSSANLANQITVESNIDYHSMDYDVNTVRTIQNSWIYDDVSIGEDGEISHGDYSDKFNEYAGRIFNSSYEGMAFSEKEKDEMFNQFKDELALSVDAEFKEEYKRFATPGRAKLVTDKAKHKLTQKVITIGEGNYEATTSGAFGEPITYSHNKNISVVNGKLNIQPGHKAYVSGQGWVSLRKQGINKSHTTNGYTVKGNVEIPDANGKITTTNVLAAIIPVDVNVGGKIKSQEMEVLFLADQFEDQLNTEFSDKDMQVIQKGDDGTGSLSVESSKHLTR